MIYTHRFNFLGIPLDALTMNETISLIDEAIQSNQKINHVVLNAGKVVSLQTDHQLKQSVIKLKTPLVKYACLKIAKQYQRIIRKGHNR